VTLHELISNSLSDTAEVPSSDMFDMVFFKVPFKPAATINKEAFMEIAKKAEGEHCNVDLFDGKEHGYMELGGWIGDQQQAMIFMALGAHLGVFELRTPITMLPKMLPTDTMASMKPETLDKMVKSLAGRGAISVIAI